MVVPRAVSCYAPLFGMVGAMLFHNADPAQTTGACPKGCMIDLQHVVTLTDAGHPNTLPQYGLSLVSASGKYLTRSRDGKRLVVFDSGGKVAGFVEGGPAHSFGMISEVLNGVGGTLRVYDVRSQSLTTISADLKIRAVVPFGYPPILALSDGRYVVAQQVATPELIGQPLHLVSQDGAIIRSFGDETGRYRADMHLLYERTAAISSDGMVWSAPLGSYLIEKWDPASGRRILQFRPQSDWFRGSSTFERPGERPVAVVEGLWEQDGYLWVLFRDADARWRPTERARNEHAFDWREYESTYDSVLEVIDINQGRVLASSRFDRPLQARPGAFLMSSYEEVGNGVSRAEVGKPHLTRKEK